MLNNIRPIYPYIELTPKNARHLTDAQRAARTLWLNALFSEAYDQTTGALRAVGQVSSMCCQGVACDLYNPKGWSDLGSFHVGENETTWDWGGTPEVYASLGFADEEAVLEIMNDGAITMDGPENYTLAEPMSHPEIAMAVLLGTYMGVM